MGVDSKVKVCYIDFYIISQLHKLVFDREREGIKVKQVRDLTNILIN